MRCLSPVSRLKTVLLPEFGLPTTAMLALGCRLTEMSDNGIRVSVALVTGLVRREAKATGLLLAERNTAAKKAKFHRITTECTSGKLDFGALDQAKNHQPLNLRVGRIDGCNNAFLAPFQRCERLTIAIHLVPAFAAKYQFFQRFTLFDVNDNDSH